MLEIVCFTGMAVAALGSVVTTALAVYLDARTPRSPAAPDSDDVCVKAVTLQKGARTVTIDLSVKSPEERERILREIVMADRAAPAR
jgi:hypothetical protein